MGPSHRAPSTNARLCAIVVLLAMFFAWSEHARADAPPATQTFGYSKYERDSIADAEKQLGVTLDLAPEGKAIEDIQAVRLEVFEKRDPLPRFLNVFHTTTKDRVITREVLQKAGEPYRQTLIDETARNLRGLSQLSLVLVIPVQGSAPDRVRVLVITKDVWSLRLQWDFVVTNNGIERLVLQPAETNLFGIHHTAGLNYQYLPFATSFGWYYIIPRIWTSRIGGSATVNLIVNNRSGDPEGSYGSVSLGQPQWSTQTNWAWNVTGQWRNEVTRRYSRARLGVFDSESTPYQDGIPFAYRSDLALVDASVTRSFGWAYKNDFVLSASGSVKQYETPNLTAFDPTAVQDFLQTRVPVSDNRVGPSLEWRSYTTSFTRVIELETLGLQEDWRLGHWLDVRLYPVFGALGSSRTFLGTFAEAGYTVPLGDGIARVDLSTTNEVNNDGIIQGSFDGELQLVTPRFGIGRLVYSARILDRYENYLNSTSYLGGNTRLRGYPSNYFVGKNVVSSNLEYRTRGFQLLGTQIGGVLFYDVGDAFDDFSKLQPKQAVGVGLRMVFPYFDRVVFRADLGFPISASPLPTGVGPVQFIVTFNQAFQVPSFGSPSRSIVDTSAR
ncbi:hypothetical protein BH09MYX1_BH09MYX1_32540 [soil metagenome]